MASEIKQYPIEQLTQKIFLSSEFEILSYAKIKDLVSKVDQDNVSFFHKHLFYAIFWVSKGSCQQTLDKQDYQLNKGDIFIICPGQVHQNNFKESWDLDGGAILMSSDFIQPLIQGENLLELTFLDNVFSNPKISLGTSDFNFLEKTTDLMFSELKNGQSSSIISHLISALLIKIQNCIDADWKHLPVKQIYVYKKFQSILDKYYREEKQVQFYANKLHITERHLNRILKDIIGKTVSELIRGRCILEAKRLLSSTDLTVAEIAAKLGYFDNSNFNKIFKKETHTTPNRFRTQMSE